MEEWSDKVAIVTGASSGIGEAIAKALVILGIHVIGLARREEKVRKLADDLKGFNGTIHPLHCDLRKEEDILNAFQYAESNHGGVDILVNAAGIAFFEPILNSSTDHFRAILEVNVLAPAITTREAVKSIRKRGSHGHIFNINSVAGRNVLAIGPPMNIYAASKFALDAMTISVREELKTNHDKIKITTIYPGLVKTGIIAASGGNPDAVYQSHPYLQPEDIANAVVFALKAPGNVQVGEMLVTPLRE